MADINATNGDELLNESHDTWNEGLFARAVEGIKTHTATAILGISVALGGAGAATAQEVRVALTEDKAAAAGAENVGGEVQQQQTEITRETLKGFMDERLHDRVDELSDEAISYLAPIMQEVLTIDNERHRSLIATGIIAVFMAPNQRDFDRATSRFDRVDIELDEIVLMAARTYIEVEELRIQYERWEILLALADDQEMIERQRERIEEINGIIEWLQSQSADLQSQSADLQSQSADLQSQSADLQSQSADLQSQIDAINNRIAQMRALQWELMQIIEDIEQAWEVQPT